MVSHPISARVLEFSQQHLDGHSIILAFNELKSTHDFGKDSVSFKRGLELPGLIGFECSAC